MVGLNLTKFIGQFNEEVLKNKNVKNVRCTFHDYINCVSTEIWLDDNNKYSFLISENEIKNLTFEEIADKILLQLGIREED